MLNDKVLKNILKLINRNLITDKKVRKVFYKKKNK